MALKTFVTDLKEIPEGLHGEYDKTEEGYVLNVDTTDYKGKISEFRGNNIKLIQEQELLQGKLDKIEDKFKGIDLEKYQQTQLKLKELEQKNLVDPGELDTKIEQRVATMKADYDGRTKALTKKLEETEEERSTLRNNLDKLTVNDLITKAASKAGNLQPGALTHIHAMANKSWKVNKEGTPVAMQADGSLLIGKDGKMPMEADEWVQDVRNTSPYLWKQNTGGGAPGSAGGRMIGGKKMVHPSEAHKYQKEIQDGKVGILIE